ncbi:16S rRNA (guanine(527)-N(7))-methyltransferase RsmG [Schwartzia succinivorans]|jgi:16S rRNA (guanine527-N7)-methyltransferase|uniref:Ribosomal RNA small subunit methyltransferase G n=1 Tax=Schwartzia succinivorans DSM 10502 TaxID=1123243 RepID=A0A1M4YDV7_9FIRM|nr:16S rRNA (guanine(527)-N(7))-methyltransferase RsmG [Schwartzia succinivorans]SHF03915.1 16S rRNA (guanine527-N7)-methyltransferase [Schwartzia succinivorans DSM 10502]
MSFAEILKKAAEEYGISLSETQLRQFDRYQELLVEWNQKMNLTALTEPKDVAIKHMIDSVSVYDEKWFSEGMSVIDVGTGAGFPGLPLKILCPSLKVTLLDSLNKRVKFLETVVSELGLSDIVCVHARAEEAARQKQYREKFDAVVSRAVARLPILAEYDLPFVRVGGFFAAMKGAKYEEEAEEAKKAVKLLGGGEPHLREIKLPGLEDKRGIIYIRKEKKTPSVYPRKAGTPEKNPIL